MFFALLPPARRPAANQRGGIRPDGGDHHESKEHRRHHRVWRLPADYRAGRPNWSGETPPGAPLLCILSTRWRLSFLSTHLPPSRKKALGK